MLQQNQLIRGPRQDVFLVPKHRHRLNSSTVKLSVTFCYHTINTSLYFCYVQLLNLRSILMHYRSMYWTVPGPTAATIKLIHFSNWSSKLSTHHDHQFPPLLWIPLHNFVFPRLVETRETRLHKKGKSNH